MAKRRSGFQLVSGTLMTLVLVGGIAAAVVINRSQQTTDNRSKAYAPDQNCGQLTALVSTTGNPADAKDSITISQNYGKYYLHVKRKDNNQPCVTAFDANAGRNVIVSPWVWQSGGVKNAAITSNSQGIARADLGSNFAVGTYPASFRQYKSSAPWSNTVTVNVVNTQVGVASATTANGDVQPAVISAKDYFMQRPGNIYIYKHELRLPNPNVDVVQKPPSRSMLQMEEKIKLGSLTVVPWRFTKENSQTYWNGGGNLNLRWYIADAGQSPAGMGGYGNWFWGVGDSRYEMSSGMNLQTLGTYKSSYLYKMTANNWPTYALMPATFKVPYLHDSTLGSLESASLADLANPQLLTNCNNKADCPNHHWKIRIENDTVNISGSRYKYQGPALRVDYYEITPRKTAAGAVDLSRQPFLLRESWYYVKNVGLVMVEQKYFNGYPTYDCRIALRAKGGAGYIEDYNKMDCSPWSPLSETDADATIDHMERPSERMILDEYDNNPTLAVKVGKIDQITAVTPVTIAKSRSEGYQVQLTPPITGWLEARTQSATGAYSAPVKWLWAEKGKVVVSYNQIKGLAPGAYNAQFRIWVPDDVFPSEKRVTDTQIPWSNLTTVNIVK